MEDISQLKQSDFDIFLSIIPIDSLPTPPLPKSIYKGVYLNTTKDFYRVTIRHNNTIHFIGIYHNEIDAARAYDKAALSMGRGREYLNFPDETYDVKDPIPKRDDDSIVLETLKLKYKRSTRSSSQYKGVTYDQKRRKWKCVYMHNGKHVYLGVFRTEEEAGRKYNQYASFVLGREVEINKIGDTETFEPTLERSVKRVKRGRPLKHE